MVNLPPKEAAWTIVDLKKKLLSGYPKNGMPRGQSLRIYARFSGKKRTSLYIFLGKKAIVVTYKDGTRIFFSHYNLFLGKLKEKLARKARVNTERAYLILLISAPPPLGIP